MTEEKKSEDIQKEPEKKVSILEKAQHKVNVDLGLKDKYEGSDIRSPQARARMQRLKRARKMIVWARRGVYIFAVFTLIYLFARYSFYTFRMSVSEFARGDKIMIDSFISEIPMISEGLAVEDKILFYTKSDKSTISVGRIYAIEGDKIDFDVDEDLYLLKINGKSDHDAPKLTKEEAETCTGTVPQGHFLVLDDTETDKLLTVFDSRQTGFIPQENVFARLGLVWSRANKKEE